MQQEQQEKANANPNSGGGVRNGTEYVSFTPEAKSLKKTLKTADMDSIRLAGTVRESVESAASAGGSSESSNSTTGLSLAVGTALHTAGSGANSAQEEEEERDQGERSGSASLETTKQPGHKKTPTQNSLTEYAKSLLGFSSRSNSTSSGGGGSSRNKGEGAGEAARAATPTERSNSKQKSTGTSALDSAAEKAASPTIKRGDRASSSAPFDVIAVHIPNWR